MASVSKDGKVTPNKAGKATITVTTKDGGFYAQLRGSGQMSRFRVAVSKPELTMHVGGTELLTAVISPADATDKSVTWSSDHPEIASVGEKDGKVTAKKTGKAVITVKTADGGHQASCNVTVLEPSFMPLPLL